MTRHGEVMARFRLDLRAYRELVARFQYHGIVEPVALEAENGFLKIDPSVVEIVRQLNEQAERVVADSGTPATESARRDPDTKTRGRIFIGHGRSRIWKDLKDFLQDRLGLQWDDFNREPAAGLSTKERLQELLDNACFAFLVMTAEETRAGGTAHARDNVIHEVGLFQGRLGFQRAIVLLEEGCSEFSNIVGLTQIRFPKDNIEAKFEEIRRVLEREGIPGEGQYVTPRTNRRSASESDSTAVSVTAPRASELASKEPPSVATTTEPEPTPQDRFDAVELKRLQREALAASRRTPEDIALFEQKLNEVDLLEGVSSAHKLNTFYELGQEVALNSDRGTILLIEHILWQIAGWDRPSIVPEIMEIAAARALLRQIAGALWDIGVTAVEYGRGEDAVQRVANAVLEVAKKSRMINAQEALATCEQGVESMLGAARSNKRTHVIGLLEQAVLRLTGEEETA